jgi:hypothetical protein
MSAHLTDAANSNGRLLTLGLVILFPLLACKLGKSDEDPESRALPAVSGAGGTQTVQAEPPKAEPKEAADSAEDDDEGDEADEEVKKVAPPKATAKPAEAAADDEESDAEKKDDSDSKSKDGTPNLGFDMKCFNACRGELTKCVNEAQKGQGADPAKCQKALANCQRDCQK